MPPICEAANIITFQNTRSLQILKFRRDYYTFESQVCRNSCNTGHKSCQPATLEAYDKKMVFCVIGIDIHQ